MEQATQETNVDTSTEPSGSVDQSGYLNDAFSSYIDGDKPKDNTEGEDPKPNEQQAVPPKEEKPQQLDKDGKPIEQANPDPFTSAFSNEAGDFDLEKLVGVSIDGLAFQSEAAPDEQQQQPESKVPQWQQEYEAERTFKQSINDSRLKPLENVFNQIKANANIPPDVRDAVLDMLNGEYVKVREENEQFFKTREQQNAFKRRQEEDEKVKAEIRNSKLPEMARVNSSAIISKLPGTDAKSKAELYNRIMFGPDAGAELLEDMFQARHPDYGKKSKQELDRMKLQFVNELQADGARLQRHFQRAYRHLIATPDNMKKIMSQVSRSADANARSNSVAAQKSPSGSVQRQPQAGKGVWDGYFSGQSQKIRV